ncbi:hypothetical protein PHYSODRAFT_492561 [Phytophthora sojae]|uniref:DDE-1 domain-containing protein n=1 Tax=Phytophthora sojae (strain P6497) TaxID=1094619 RepID=G4ZAL8_PHYSP|nr:hypothetical protein PHYSODRAFT_492561 [Phytophthora sojae]EGZ19215.1 hypothetical protein PHYSODRAFT_492561 [Phytophthora sojae]|eukprot:XP_009521932.1 hypothetical protein PHYSODRAFT_492561 [Phytophthora sojae]
MLDWIENAWKPIVTEPSLLILDSLKVHKMAEVLDALACTGTAVQFVPGGCTGVAQPLDVGVMAPLKQPIRKCYSNRPAVRPRKITPGERRYGMYCRAISGWERITEDTVRNAFHKAGPFVQYGPPLHG